WAWEREISWLRDLPLADLTFPDLSPSSYHHWSRLVKTRERRFWSGNRTASRLSRLPSRFLHPRQNRGVVDPAADAELDAGLQRRSREGQGGEHQGQNARARDPRQGGAQEHRSAHADRKALGMQRGALLRPAEHRDPAVQEVCLRPDGPHQHHRAEHAQKPPQPRERKNRRHRQDRQRLDPCRHRSVSSPRRVSRRPVVSTCLPKSYRSDLIYYN